MDYNENILTKEKQEEISLLIKHYPHKFRFQAGIEYPISVAGQEKNIILDVSILKIQSNRDKVHYRIYNESQESGAQATALVSHIGFKIKEDGTLQILGKQRNQPAKFLKSYDHDDDFLTTTILQAEQECLTLTKAKTKPITSIKVKRKDTPKGPNKIISILTQDYIEGIDGQKALDDEYLKNLSDDDMKARFLELCHTLKILHDNNIVHADIKPANIMFSEEAKLVDFGLSHTPAKNKINGTLLYMPPEIFDDKQCTKAGDVFSLVLAFIDILSKQKASQERRNKFPNSEQLYRLNIHRMKINTDIFDDKNNSVKKNIFFNLLRSMLDFDPESRPTIDDCIEQINNIDKAEKLYTTLENIRKIEFSKNRGCRLFNVSTDPIADLKNLLSKKPLNKSSYKELLTLTKKSFSILWYEFEKFPSIPNNEIPKNQDVLFGMLKSLSDLLTENDITTAKVNDEPIKDIVTRIESRISVGSAPSSPCHRR